MSTTELQHQLFQAVKNRIAEDLTPEDEIAKVLSITPESANQRLKGELSISLEELYKLSTYYRISLDQIFNIQTGAIVFNGRYVQGKEFRFDEWLTNIMHNLAYFTSFKDTEIYYLCKDIPLFHHYHLQEIAAFKYFFFQKTIIHLPEFRAKRFSFKELPDEIFKLGKRCLDLYRKASVIEFWSIETINIMIRQIEFYRESEVFESDEDIFILYNALENMIHHMEKQADLGYQFNFEDKMMMPLGSFQMYFNEVLIGDNSSLIILDGSKQTMINHTGVNFMITRDTAFCENMYQHCLNLMRKSTLISSANEKERARFFKFLRDKITRRKESLVV